MSNRDFEKEKILKNIIELNENSKYIAELNKNYQDATGQLELLSKTAYITDKEHLELLTQLKNNYVQIGLNLHE